MDFRCDFQKNNQQVEFYWANLTGSGYSNLSISIVTEQNKHVSTILCDPYASANLCSTKSARLEPGREYHIYAKLRKSLPNYNGQKTETCSIKTSKNIE